MKTLIVYDSAFGNTEHIARAIAATLGEGGPAPMVAVQDMGVLDVPALDLLVVGGPTQRHGISPELRAALNTVPAGSLRGIAVATFDTRMRAARILTGSAATRIAKLLEQMGARLVMPPESFLVTQREGPLAEGEATRACGWAARVRAAVQAQAEKPVTGRSEA